MDYQEAIEVINNHERYVGVKYVNGVEESYVTPYFEKALDTAISAMQELHEYRKLGTLEEMKLLKATHLTGVELAQISCMLKQLAEYEKIGTLEEVRDAVEKQCEHCGYKIHSDNISKLNSCNDCGMKTVCKKRPDYGDYCRINCYDWSEVEE